MRDPASSWAALAGLCRRRYKLPPVPAPGDNPTRNDAAKQPAPLPAITPPGLLMAGRFTLLQELGSGSWGTVYRARDLQPAAQSHARARDPSEAQEPAPLQCLPVADLS